MTSWTVKIFLFQQLKDMDNKSTGQSLVALVKVKEIQRNKIDGTVNN
jgi:hypothetical protein